MQNPTGNNPQNNNPDLYQEDLAALEEESALIEEISEEFKKGYKLYNFRRPDKFSKEHLRALQEIGRASCRERV